MEEECDEADVLQVMMMLMTKVDKLIAIRQRLQRAIGGDWLFDVPLWVHEWDR